MLDRYVDGAEWVMAPNVMGIGLWADRGRMVSKPYVSGGAYINRMSDCCGDCRYDAREHRFVGNHRLARLLANMRRLRDLDTVRARAQELGRGIRDGRV